MKKMYLLIASFILAIGTQAQVKAPKPSPSSKIEQVIGLTEVNVSYSRPSMKGRNIYGDLVPYDKLWRTGANKNTEISFSDNVKVNGQELKKGNYALFTKPGKDSWEITFYSDTENWGTPKKWDDSKVATKFTVKPTTIPMNVETFTLMFSDLKMNSGLLNLIWENTEVALKIEVPAKEATIANIEKAMAGPSANDHYKAASFYYEIEDYTKAKNHIDKAVSLHKKPAFWMYRKQSLIYAKSNDKKGAVEAAKTSLELAKKAGNDDYIKMNTDFIKELAAK